MLEPLIVTLGDVLALALITPDDGLLPEASSRARTQLTVGGQAAICACWAVEAELAERESTWTARRSCR